MADLRTDYKDDVLDTEVNELRKYQMIQNEDGTVSFVDVTEYLQVGDSFGSADINETNAEIEEIKDNQETKYQELQTAIDSKASTATVTALQTELDTKLSKSGGQITGPITGTSNNFVMQPDGNIYSDAYGGWLSEVLATARGDITNLLTRFPKTCCYVPNNDWNNAVETGFYMGANITNAPSANWYMGIVYAHNTSFVVQEILEFTDGTLNRLAHKYTRQCRSGVWGNWIKEPRFSYDATTGTLDITL